MPPVVKVALFDCKPYDRESFTDRNREFGFQLEFITSQLSEKTVRLADGFDVVCVFVNDDLSEPVIKTLSESSVRLVALRCAGYNNVNFKAAYDRLHVVHVPAYSPHAVAEHAAALLLTLNRKTHKAYSRTRDGNFSLTGLMGFDLFGKTAGVIGTGRIGLILLQILKGFGMRLLAFDKFPNQAAAQEIGFTYVPLPQLFQESDVISLNCPLNQETHHLVNADTIAAMKKGVFIINTGRGPLVDTKALVAGLKSQKIGAAGLDVYEEESSYFFEDYSAEIMTDDVLARLLSFNNVLVTSHQAFFTAEALQNIAETTLENIRVFFSSATAQNEICYRCTQGAKGACRRKNAEKCF